MPRKTQAPTQGTRRQLEDEALARVLNKDTAARLEKEAYLDIGTGVKDSRRSRLPANPKPQTAADYAALVRDMDKSTGTDRRKKPSAPIVAPDMHDGEPELAIQGLKVNHGGTFVTLEFKTDVACKAYVGVGQGFFTAVINYKTGNYDFSNQPEAFGFTPKYGTQHKVSVPYLKPDTNYKFVILLAFQDQSHQDTNKWKPVQGNFKTGRRHVIVKINKIDMIDAADFGGTGEVQLRTQIGKPGFDKSTPGNSIDHTGYPLPGGFVKMKSGKSYPLNLKMIGFDVGDAIELTFGVLEQDEGGWTVVFPFIFNLADTSGTGNQTDAYLGTFDTGSYEANSGSWTYTFPNTTFMSGGANTPLASRETYTVETIRHVPPAGVTDLEYTIHGTFTVFYDFNF